MRALSIFALGAACLQNFTTAFSRLTDTSGGLVARQEVSSSAPTNSTTFILDDGHLGDGTSPRFTLTAAKDGDLWFRMSGSSAYSFIAFGIGLEMKGALMFIMYQGSSSSKVTLSPRMAKDHIEPTYSNQIQLQVIPAPLGDMPNGVSKAGVFYATGHCKNCSNLALTKIDLKNTKQPFIYALGPAQRTPNSDALDAPLRRHSHYGYFQMDMTKAIGDGVPNLGGVNQSTQVGHDKKDHELASPGHAFVMGLAFLIVFPMGIIAMRLFNRVKIHMILQSIGAVLVLIGFVNGLIISQIYNRSRKVNSGHQIIGIIVFVALVAQWVLGFLHHRTMERTQQPLRWAILPHKMALGHIILGMGLVNISLGFRFALAGILNRVYVPIAIVMLIFLALSVFFKRWFQTKWPGNRPQGGRGPVAVTYGEPQPGPYGAYSGESASAGGPAPPYGGYEARSDIALDTMDRPPAYGAGPTKPREFT